MVLFRRFRDWWGKKLHRRLLVSFIATLSIFLTLLGYLSFRTGHTSVQHEVEQGNRRLAALAAKDISAQYDTIISNARLLRHELEAPAVTLPLQARTMLELGRAAPLTYRALYLFDSEGHLLVHLADPLEDLLAIQDVADIIDRPSIPLEKEIQTARKGATSGDLFLSTARIVGADQVPVIYMGIPVVVEDGQSSQIVVVEIDLRDFWRRIDEIYVGQTGRAFIVSREGIIIAHPGRSYIGQPVAPELERVLAGYEGQTEYTDPLSGARLLASYSPVGKQSGWGIVIEQEQAEALAPVTRITFVTLGVLLAAVVMAMIVATLIAQSITQPIQRLAEATQTIAHTGELGQSIVVKGQDEVGQLAAAFNQMIASLRQAEQAVQERTDEIELLYKAGQQIGQTLDIETIYQRLHALVATAMDCDGLFVSSYDPEEGLFCCDFAITEGNQLDVSQFPPILLEPEGQGTQSVTIRTGEPLLIRDYQARMKATTTVYHVDEEGNIVGRDEVPEDEDVTRSALIVPMKIERQVVGVIQVMSYRLDAYAEDDLRILESLSSQIAVASNNALLYQQAQHSLQELLAIYQAAQRLQQLHTPETLAQEIITVLEQALDYEYGAVLLIDEPTGQLTPFALSDQGRGPAFAEADKAYVASHGTRLGEGIAGWVAQTGQSVRLGDVRQDQRYYSMRDDIRSELCVPLYIGDKTVGVVNVETSRPNAYTEGDQRVLETVTAQVATAIQNARLYEQIQRHAAELEGRVAKRTEELNKRVAEVEGLNRAMTNLLNDLQASNRKLAETGQELQRANAELETFTYSVSHDLKAPLRGIDGYSQLLLQDHAGQLDDEGRTFLHTIRRAAEQMNQLIEDLLAYSHMERRAMRTTSVNPRALVEALVAEYAEEMRKRGVGLTMEVPSQAVMAEAEGLTQALHNLLDNALKFTRDAPEPRIEVGGRDTEKTCIIWVRDNGVGFDMQYHDRIFEIFQRLHRAEEYPGTGIGLAIVRKAMQRMGGRVWAESTPGEGATFYLEIPR